MAREEGKVHEIEKFDGSDFGYWKMQIEDYLYGRGLEAPLIGKKLEKMSEADWEVLDRRVLGIIRLTLTKSVSYNIAKEKTVTGMMAVLSSMYEKPSANNKVHLMKKLFNLKMTEGSSVASHLNDFNTITNQLSAVSIEFDDEIRAFIFLASLPNSWEAMRMAVSNSARKEKLKYVDIRDLVLSEEVRRRDSGESHPSTSGSALNTEGRVRSRTRGSHRGRSKLRKGRSASKTPLSEIQCWNCSQMDHYRRHCKEPKKKNGAANVVTENNQDALLLSVDSLIDSFTCWDV